ncbi:hypothetical protein P280DRAFT_471981, partial [Massarina eburnea CBS 473.64]
MYKPAPPRPKKTNIVRTRTGCKECRRRRKKCDEKKPSCATCMKLGRRCEPVYPNLVFHTSTPGGQQKHTGHDLSIPPESASQRPACQTSHYSTQSSAESTLSPQGRNNNDQPESYIEQPDSLDGEHNLVSPRLFPGVLQHRNTTEPIRFYINVWRHQCLPALHLAFHPLESNNSSPRLIKDIIIALSACRLSRALPQKKICNALGIPGLVLRPDTGHEALSHQHYGKVMRKIANWSSEDFNVNPTFSVAILVLFCYLESSMGNFREFRVHSDGIKRMIQSFPQSAIVKGADPLAAWVEVEIQNWWRRVYFSTPEFHRTHDSLQLHTHLETVLNTADHRRATILLLLCESHRLSTMAVVSCWEDPEHTSLTEYAKLLEAQSTKLEDWLFRLPSFELPTSGDVEQEHTAYTDTGLRIQPLCFRSHISAMNFAYYITARAMQCYGPLELLQGADLNSAYEEVESWILVILQIAAGIDWAECVRLNIYTLGFANLLLACVLRSHSLAIGLWIQNWLEERLKGDEPEEGNFPVSQIMGALRLVNAERRDGRDVFALFQTVDDEGGCGKLGSYCSQRLVMLQVYGRCRVTGRKYSYRKAV